MNGPLGGGNGSDETEWKEGRGRWKVRYIQDLLRPWFVSGGLCVVHASMSTAIELMVYGSRG